LPDGSMLRSRQFADLDDQLTGMLHCTK